MSEALASRLLRLCENSFHPTGVLINIFRQDLQDHQDEIVPNSSFIPTFNSIHYLCFIRKNQGQKSTFKSNSMFSNVASGWFIILRVFNLPLQSSNSSEAI